MKQLRSLGEVAEASRADPQCMWAAQGLTTGGAAWANGRAVAVGCPALSGRDRLVVRGPARDAASLVRAVIDSLGPSFVAIGDPQLMGALLARIGWLEHATYFRWMDSVSRPQHQPVHKVRWLARKEWQSADRVLSMALPDSFARPGLPGVGRWAGITDSTGKLTSIAADAWSAPGIGFLASVAVIPEARGAGQGRDVCAFVLDALLAAHGRVAVMAGDLDSDATSMYIKLGLSYRRQQMLRVKVGHNGARGG